MVIKAFTGGYEQTSSVTVQCIVTSPGDFILNDSLGDFGLRAAGLEALDSAHPDLPAGTGVGFENRHGAKAEHGGQIGLARDGSGYHTFPVDDPSATECNMHITPGAPAGFDSAGGYHSHSYTWPDSAYGCGADLDSLKIYYSDYPGDGRMPAHPPKQEDEGGGSVADWDCAKYSGIPQYVFWKDGTVYRLDPQFVGPHNLNPNHWKAFGPGTRKCAWPRLYHPS